MGIYLINGNEREMQMGDLCMIRPWKDAHKFQTLTPAFMIYNVAFPLMVLRDVQKRYFDGAHFWGGIGRESESHHLTEVERQWMNATGRGHPDHFRACPPWLRLACQLIHEPEHFSRGPHGFAALAKHSPEHVARALKKYAGKTPSEVVNPARMLFPGNTPSAANAETA